ncbi:MULTISPECIES: ADP-ribosylglycohydrolase family protein [unclassified Arcicella]|uniref:ADP-ribosylglycohydrolase family protein n=1 Tax=unclassified Arcicella TaxID=2644986 RepID=UPI0028558973|nr:MULTISPECIES: ADP-ribosylglycohydrolase family protein [unclassified Arcicella]MDR6560132.1 ADP-ribosylglycohydrolase [Arcicella sp. BE51]MDR6810261.1 ADP-ribosylglycohydrolase [Arcicella sp. BE140]MDR6821611.1 ADP-ribosylglycohydrolase [Arcicella sp. BE139]
MQHSKGLLFGIATGDALGVPVEFMSRKHLQAKPVVGMREYGTHHQPAGTWSDDTSMSLCLAEQLIEGYDIEQLAKRLCDWYQFNVWTPREVVFDVGVATRNAIDKILKGVSPYQSGECDDYSNGNGSLMRILPLAFYLKNKPIDQRFCMVKEVSSITHAHVRTIIGCFFAVEFVINLLKEENKFEAYYETQNTVRDYLHLIQIKNSEIELYNRILFDDIFHLAQEEIFSSGYILHTLEASLWTFLTTDNFHDAVLKGINLGGDTDTIGSVTGGMAGLYYGFDQIPAEWINQLARKEDILALSNRFSIFG